MSNVPRLIKVEPKKNMTLIVKFENGDKKLMDIKPYLKFFDVFNELKDEKVFNKVKVVYGGFGIAWNKRIDLDRYDLWEYGKTVK
ncbi:MAG: DUF2442 domain-containing protein [Endomicrobium sp.]|jgi:hypothetical protein|uniref:DUF2442 domain-containing protein n=1 Tax=Candidatus Endomicrobiellum pyrsonymphae TaxID=1408203 RepID=UPI0035791428|nr:DUF2442 domain-containing protein [Endomicrobium sp.]